MPEAEERRRRGCAARAYHDGAWVTPIGKETGAKMEVEEGAEQRDRIVVTLAPSPLVGNTEVRAHVKWLPASGEFVCLKSGLV